MQKRTDFEDREVLLLAAYAVKAKDSKGRLYPEEEDSLRTAFQRDRDRIIHSKAFRRLKHKTQVFMIYQGDHYRTRLTHTLEVAQIARQLARTLNLNEDLAECIALAHDLGHTPFGHAGEEVLDELMADYGGFEHNRQSKRVVEYIETKYPGHNGLNLSLEVLEGLMKHQTPYDHPGMNELTIVFPSLEAEIVNLADELAYVNHDLDDGLSSGILDNDDLMQHVELWREVYLQNKQQEPTMASADLRFLTVRKLIHLMVVDVLTCSESQIKTYCLETLKDVYQHQQKIIDFSEKMRSQVSILEKYLSEHFYQDYRVYRMVLKGKKYLTDLFYKFNEHPHLLPKNEYQKISTNEFKARIITDYIAGMTDNFAIEEHKRIFELYEIR